LRPALSKFTCNRICALLPSALGTTPLSKLGDDALIEFHGQGFFKR